MNIVKEQAFNSSYTYNLCYNVKDSDIDENIIREGVCYEHYS